MFISTFSTFIAIVIYLFAIFSGLFELIILIIFSGVVAAIYSVADNSIILDASPSGKKDSLTEFGVLFGV